MVMYRFCVSLLFFNIGGRSICRVVKSPVCNGNVIREF